MFKIIIILMLMYPLTLSAQWIQINSHVGQKTSLFVVNADTVVVTGYDGRIFRTFNGGQTWSFYQTIFGQSWFTDVHFPTQSVGYACGGSAFGLHKSIIAKTMDGGQTWDSLTSDALAVFFLDHIYFVNADTGFISGDGNSLIKTYDGGNSFSQTNLLFSGIITEIYFSSLSQGFISTINEISANTHVSSIYRSIDLGETWTTVYSDTMVNVSGSNHRRINKIHLVDDLTGYAVGGNGLFLKTTDGGITWNSTFIPPFTALSGLYFTSSSVGFINNAGGIYMTMDGGITWSVQNVFPLSIINFISFANDTVGYAIGDVNIYKTTNGGILNNIDDVSDAISLFFFPNPAKDFIAIKKENNLIEKITIYDTYGKIIQEIYETFDKINISGLSNGIYFISAIHNKGICTQKIIKQ